MKECVYLAMAAIETGKDFLVIITVTAKRKRNFIKNVKSCGCKLIDRISSSTRKNVVSSKMYPKKENPKVKEHKICIFHDYLPQIFTPKLQIG